MKKSNSILISNQEGFTLLEILIAIVLLAFITMGVVSVTENAFDTKDRTTQVNKDNLEIETAMSRFEWDFSQIYSPLFFTTAMNFNQGANNAADNVPADPDAFTDPGNPLSNSSTTMAPNLNPNLQAYAEALTNRLQTNEHFLGVSKDGALIPRNWAPEKNIFEFFTASNRRKLENTKQSHYAWVRYSLAEPDAEQLKASEEKRAETDKIAEMPSGLKNLVRYFAVDDPYDDKRINIEEGKIKAAVLLTNVESLEFQYWDYTKRKWETSLKAIQNGESVVRGVKVIMSWYDSQGLKRKTERIFRNHWPMVVPQDTAPAATAAGGNNGGNTANSGNSGNDQTTTTASGGGNNGN